MHLPTITNLKKKSLFIAFTLTFLLGLSFFAINILQSIQIIKADQRIHFTKLLENENVSEKLKKSMYLGLFADYCGFKSDIDSAVFKYTLYSEMNGVINSIDDSFNTYLKDQRNALKDIKCNI